MPHRRLHDGREEVRALSVKDKRETYTVVGRAITFVFFVALRYDPFVARRRLLLVGACRTTTLLDADEQTIVFRGVFER